MPTILPSTTPRQRIDTAQRVRHPERTGHRPRQIGGSVDRDPDVNTHLWPAEFAPTTYVCGPTGFVERVSDMLVAPGHDPRTIRTERFG